MSSLFEQAYQAWDDGKLEIAFKLFREAAAQGDRSSILNLGYCYDLGIGTRKNPKKAMYWYKKAALEYSDLSAYKNIALCYAASGNFGEAKRWFSDALQKGDKSAALGLAKLGLEKKVHFSQAELANYLQIVIDADFMGEVCESEYEEACLLLEQLQAKMNLNGK
jgi:TPR repeat protein